MVGLRHVGPATGVRPDRSTLSASGSCLGHEDGRLVRVPEEGIPIEDLSGRSRGGSPEDAVRRPEYAVRRTEAPRASGRPHGSEAVQAGDYKRCGSRAQEDVVMTEEEIDAMIPGRELDALIEGKIMGRKLKMEKGAPCAWDGDGKAIMHGK